MSRTSKDNPEARVPPPHPFVPPNLLHVTPPCGCLSGCLVPLAITVLLWFLILSPFGCGPGDAWHRLRSQEVREAHGGHIPSYYVDTP